jgi:hypothetical protein
MSEHICNIHAGQIVTTLPPSQAPGTSHNPAGAAVDIVLKGQYWQAAELKHGVRERQPLSLSQPAHVARGGCYVYTYSSMNEGCQLTDAHDPPTQVTLYLEKSDVIC